MTDLAQLIKRASFKVNDANVRRHYATAQQVPNAKYDGGGYWWVGGGSLSEQETIELVVKVALCRCEQCVNDIRCNCIDPRTLRGCPATDGDDNRAIGPIPRSVWEPAAATAKARGDNLRDVTVRALREYGREEQ